MSEGRALGGIISPSPSGSSTTAAACAWIRAALVLLVVMVSGGARAVIVLDPGADTESMIAAWALNQFLGVTVRNFGPDAALSAVRGTLYRFELDPCRADPGAPVNLTGRVVLVTQPIRCPYFMVYDRFGDRNATAIIRSVTQSLGDSYFLESQYDRRPASTRNQNVVLVEARFPQAGDDHVLSDGRVVLVRADVPAHILWHAALWARLVWRWVPAAAYSVIVLVAAHYLRRHRAVLQVRRAGPPRSETALIRLALVISVVKNALMVVEFGVGGYFTDPALSYEVQYALGSHLWGCENAIAIITARVWYRVAVRADRTAKRAAFSAGATTTLVAVLLALDVLYGYMYVTYRQYVAGVDVIQLAGAVSLSVTVLVAAYFTVTIVMLQVRIRARVQSPTATKLTRFGRRLRALVVLSSAFIAAYVSSLLWFVTVIMNDVAVQYDYLICFWIVNMTMAVRSLLSTLMLKPREVRRSPDRGSRVAVSPL